MLVKLILVLLFAIAILKYYRSNNYVENFSNNKKIIEIESDDIYDKFYSNIYDQLFGDGAKNKFEIKESPFKKKETEPTFKVLKGMSINGKRLSETLKEVINE